jgi:hypothetical protein
MASVIFTTIPTVFFKNEECGRLFNANMNYVMPSDGPRSFTVNGQKYIKNGTETLQETGQRLSDESSAMGEKSPAVYIKYTLEGNDAEIVYFRVNRGILSIGFNFIFPSFRSKKAGDDAIQISYNVGRGYYAGFFECSSADHEVKISDSGNVVLVEKESGSPVYVIWW